MKHFYLNTLVQRVISVEDGRTLAKIDEVIIDKESGKIQAFVVSNFFLFMRNRSLVVPQDIAHWTNNLYVKDNEALSDPEDIVRLKDTYLNFKNIINLDVYTKRNLFLGKIVDFSLCDVEFKLLSLIVEKSDKIPVDVPKYLEITKSEIIRILDDKVIVKDLFVGAEDTEEENLNLVLEPNF